jgi:hypothetical protein
MSSRHPSISLVAGLTLGLLFAPALCAGNSSNGSDQNQVILSGTTVTEGSTTTSRAQTDQDPGQVYIYVGGTFPAETSVNSFQFLFDLSSGGNTSGYITPLLFERVPSGLFLRYIVRAIGQGFKVNLSSTPQTVNFTVAQGVTVTTVVDFDNPGDSGQGVGGQHTTNAWALTINTQKPPAVPLDATSGFYGKGVYSLFVPYRTYSAQVVRDGSIARRWIGWPWPPNGCPQLFFRVPVGFLAGWFSQSGHSPDFVIVDPPRRRTRMPFRNGSWSP